MNDTPRGCRVRLAFFGLRNAGKSTLVNAFTGQELAIVSDTPGTTTDPVSKAMEILPLGPCLVTDTAGLDDVGELGAKRVEKSLAVLAESDLAIWVTDADGRGPTPRFLAECRRHGVKVLEYRRGEAVAELRRRVAAVQLEDAVPGLLAGLVTAGDRVLAVCPIDAAAPKGRLILPQQQLLRACLDAHAFAAICQVEELAAALERFRPTLVVTDSQAFKSVAATLRQLAAPPPLTSFSILLSRQKGKLAEFLRGVEALTQLQDGDTVLVAEGCTHHRQCDDIGTVKIPKAVTKLAHGRRLNFVFSSGADFALREPRPAAVVHCGACMLSPRELKLRLEAAHAAGIPVANYGLVLAAAAGIRCNEQGLIELRV